MSSNKTNNTIQAAWVALGSIFAFSFSIVSSMILSRYFDKADYGTYKQVIYIYNSLLVVFTLGLPKTYAYFLPRCEDRCAKTLIKKITRIFYILGGIFSLLLFLFSSQIASAMNNPNLTLALKVFSPVPLIMLPTMGIEGIFATYQKNKYMAIYNAVTKCFILLCVVLPVIIWKGDYIDALIGFTVSSLISLAAARYLRYRCLKDKGSDPITITYKDIMNFSLPLLMASLWGIVIRSTDKFFISRYFGTEVFADYSNGALELPFVGMIIGACSAVLLPLFSRKVHENADKSEILAVWMSVFKKTIMLTYPLVMFFVFYSTEVMTILYGDMYASSGDFFRIKLILNFFTVASYFPILLAIGATKFYRNVQMWGAIAIVLLEFLSVLLFDNPYIVVIVSVACTIARILVMIQFIAKYFKSNFLSIIPVQTGTIILTLSMGLLSIINYLEPYLFNDINLLQLVILFVIYIILYISLSHLLKLNYTSIITPIFKKITKK